MREAAAERAAVVKRHTITLAAPGRVLSVAAYVQGIRLAKAEPLMMFRHGLTTWWPCAGSTIMHQFREGCRERQRQRAAARPLGHLPRHERYLCLLRETTDVIHQRMLPAELRRDANPRLVGEQVDNFRELYLWRARREAQGIAAAAMHAGRAS